MTIPPSNYLDDVEPDPRPDVSRTPAPPRPPHPALLALRQAVWVRLSTSLDQLSTSLASEHSNLVALQHDLLRGEPALLDEIGRLEAVRDVCVGVAGRYREASDMAEGRSVELERKGEPDPDEMVCSTTVLYNQSVQSRLSDSDGEAEHETPGCWISTPRTKRSRTRSTISDARSTPTPPTWTLTGSSRCATLAPSLVYPRRSRLRDRG